MILLTEKSKEELARISEGKYPTLTVMYTEIFTYLKVCFGIYSSASVNWEPANSFSQARVAVGSMAQRPDPNRNRFRA